MLRIGNMLIPPSRVAYVEDQGHGGVVHLLPGTVAGRDSISVHGEQWVEVRERLMEQRPPVSPGRQRRVRPVDAAD